MKLIKSLHPKNLFRSNNPKNRPHISKSAPTSFNTVSSSSSSDVSDSTPINVLPPARSLSSCSDLVEAFKLIDRDGAGKITNRELETVLNQDLTSILAEIEGDGCTTLEELKETFDVFDSDHDGKITAEELLRVFVSIGDERCTSEDCRRMIEGVDVNGDGFVCIEDFTRMMMVHQQ